MRDRPLIHRLGQGLVWCVALAASRAGAAPPAGSAYDTDPQLSYVQDQTGAGIAEVNMIACIMAAVRPDALVNLGPYVALVDQNVCSNQTVAATSSVDAAAGIAPNYQSAVVSSLRQSNSDPQRSELWIDGTSNGQPSRTWVNLSVTSAPAAGAPYGVFRLDFCQAPANSDACAGEGYVIGTNSALNFYQAVTGGGHSLTRALTLTTTGATAGSGAMSVGGSGAAVDYTFAYDATLFRRSDGSNDECFSRDATDPGTGFTGWSYGLYDATTGARVTLNSGMPISFSVNDTTYSAYVGYWGVSVPAAATGMLASGMPVRGLGYDSATGGSSTSNYTLVMAPGRLVRYSKQMATLRDLDQIRFDVWVNDATALYSGAPDNTYFEAYWDDTTGMFYVSGIVNCTATGCTTSALPAPQPVSAGFWIPLGGVQAWSQSFGGDLYINLQGVTLPLASTQVPVAYRSQSLVSPNQVPATLYCINDCPTAATLAAYFTPAPTASSPYGASFNNYAPTGDAGVVTYTSDGTSGVLADPAGQPVVLTNPTALASQPQYLNGVSSGRLFVNLADAQCVPGTAGAYCDYKVSNLPDYYVWQTGSQPWNQFAGLKDATGAFVPFSAPLNVSFAVPNSSAYGAYAGTSVVLQYGGYGQLYGFPNQCVDASTNLAAACTEADARVIPAFMIPMDTSAGVVTGGTTRYLVKWLNREIRLAVKDPSLCLAAGLTLPTGLALPDASGLANPAAPGTPVYIGAEPVVTAAPRVIQGVVEY